jgi:hypothetical protein
MMSHRLEWVDVLPRCWKKLMLSFNSGESVLLRGDHEYIVVVWYSGYAGLGVGGSFSLCMYRCIACSIHLRYQHLYSNTRRVGAAGGGG